jgi:antitoxin (DNA-binding transcriptional repressor) of toxin-antitoxin stability system
MKALNISEARNSLPALVASVSATHAPVVLLRYGKPAAMIVPVLAEDAEDDPYPLRKVPITVADDFDAPTPGLWEALAVAEMPTPYTATHKPDGQAKPKRRKP